MEEKTKINNIMKKIIIFISLIVLIVGIHTMSIAYTTTTDVDGSKTFNKGDMLPERNTNGASGMFPQYYLSGATRNITIDDSRLNWKTNNWQATMDGKVIYCSAYGRYVRYGKYENKIHYLIPNKTTIQGKSFPITGDVINSQVNNIAEKLRKKMQERLKAAGTQYYKNIETGTTGASADTVAISIKYSNVPQKAGVGYVIAPTEVGGIYKDEAHGLSQAQAQSITNMTNLLSAIGKEIWPSKYSTSVDGSHISGAITATEGPEVVVLEQTEKANDHYKDKAGTPFSNNQKAFIFSACEEVYNQDGNHAQEYELLNDLQGAYWKVLEQEGDTTPTEHVTANAINLYNKSVEYDRFLKDIKDGYKASINSSEAQVIVDKKDKNNKKYIVGPFSLNYPMYEDISYVKSLVINDKLVYDETHEGFKIILDEKGTATPGSNGMLKEYPKSGQRFFVIVEANKIGIDTTKLNLKANFEYISNTYANVENTLTANADIYKYYGYSLINQSEKYHMVKGSVQIYATWLQGNSTTVHTEECLRNKWHENTQDSSKYTCCGGTQLRRNDTIKGYPTGNNSEFDVYQPYIQMGEDKVGSSDAQKLIVVGDANRNYTVHTEQANIDLTMKLGGYAWEDEEGGKESIANGVIDIKEENGIPNLKVRLYRENGSLIGETKTDKNGEYRFSGLNAMYEYSVKFLYNGQYYQPTTFEDSSTWGSSKWQINSNAKDIRAERISYNAKFEKIGSSPENYEIKKDSKQYNETFTKYQLMGYVLNEKGEYVKSQDLEPVIDSYLDCSNENHKHENDHDINCYKTYGNLILNSSDNKTTQKMIQYVKDCMMEASTTADNAEGLYPTPLRFLIDYRYKWVNTPKLLASNGIAGIERLYPNAYYINLGLVHREETDLAISKDVEKVTLEINGQVHEYTYDHLEGKLGKYHCDNCNHEGENKDLLNVNGQSKCPDCEFKCIDCNNQGIAKELVLDKNEYGRQIQKCPKCESTNIEQKEENIRQLWDINVRLSDAYYDASYSREIYKSDYLYKASMYEGLEKSKDGELEVYITYKVMVRNQAMSIQTRVDEIVDYYDKDLKYVDERSYIEIKRGNNAGKYAVQADYNETTEDSNSKYGKNTRTTIEGYNNLYIRGLGEGAEKIVEDEQGNVTKETLTNGIYLEAGQTAYLYLTFNVKKEADSNGEEWVKLDEIIGTGSTQISNTEYDVGKENIVEINGYSTIYAPGTYIPNVVDEKGNLKDVGGTPAGIVDRDSNPGNLNPNDVPKNSNVENGNDDKYENFEDDTDKAPNIRIILNRDDNSTRVISGSVWEDTRTQEIAGQATATGDGNKDENSTLINGVTVQLVELMEDGTEFVWREFGNIDKATGENGGSGTISSEYPIINAIVKGNDIRLVKITEIPQLAEGEELFIPNYEFNEENGYKDNNYNGAYAFKSFMPGKYVVKFIYGDTEKTVLPSNLEVEGLEKGLNAKSYNGQDYKSTTYQKGVQQNKTYTWREDSTWVNGKEILGKELTVVSTFKIDASNNERVSLPEKDANGNFETITVEEQKGYLYDITESEKYNGSDEQHQIVSDAKDIASIRDAVNDYSDNDVTNYIAEVLASHKKDYDTMNDRKTLLQNLMNNTKMTAATGLMVIELEYDAKQTVNQKVDNTSTYRIQNVDLGLEERPKAQLAIDKEVTNVKLVLADGTILFDAKNTATNLLWKDHKSYNEHITGKEGLMAVYDSKLMKNEAYESIEKIRDNNKNKFGLIQLSMDEELMHGATMEISYKITVANIGEVDYKDDLFYYTGVVSDKTKVVKTTANQILDYVANNLQFNVNNNSGWKVIEKDEIKSQGLVNAKLNNQIEKFNTIIGITEDNNLGTPLVSNLYKEEVDKNALDSVSAPLVLTQLITSENDTDDLTYNNLVEIVKTSNDVGRRMEYSVVGNQNPTKDPQELDSDIAEVVKILPPFGNAGAHIIILVVSLATIAIITVGIILIKKKVLTK